MIKPGMVALTAMLLGALCSASAMADKPAKVKYVPPVGFGGYQWGALHSSFERLSKDPVGVGAAFTRPVEMATNFTCIPVSSSASSVGDCDFNAMLNSLRKDYEGGGFYVLSEYTIEGQGFRYGAGDDGVLLHPVVYQFCANWDDTKKVLPENFDQIDKFCGVRLLFRSETPAQLRDQPADYVTNYDRLLKTLLAKFGKPDGFTHRGRVLIETEEGDSGDASDRKFSIWRWCPARDRGLHTSCSASVVLTLDPSTGLGTLLYSTPLLWEYAYARQNGGFKGDMLFRMLHARGN